MMQTLGQGTVTSLSLQKLYIIYLKEKATPKSLLVLLILLIALQHSACPLTEVSASEAPTILKKFVSKEETLEATRGIAKIFQRGGGGGSHSIKMRVLTRLLSTVQNDGNNVEFWVSLKQIS